MRFYFLRVMIWFEHFSWEMERGIMHGVWVDSWVHMESEFGKAKGLGKEGWQYNGLDCQKRPLGQRIYMETPSAAFNFTVVSI